MLSFLIYINFFIIIIFIIMPLLHHNSGSRSYVFGLAMHPTLMNTISQERLEGISFFPLLGLTDEVIRF